MKTTTAWLCGLFAVLSSVQVSAQEVNGGNAGAAIGGAVEIMSTR